MHKEKDYVQVRIRKNTYRELLKVVGLLQIRTLKRVSFSDAIDYLLEKEKNKEIKI